MKLRRRPVNDQARLLRRAEALGQARRRQRLLVARDEQQPALLDGPAVAKTDDPVAKAA